MECIDDNNRRGWSIFSLLLGIFFLIVFIFLLGRGLDKDNTNYIFFFTSAGICMIIGWGLIFFFVIISKLPICSGYINQVFEEQRKNKV